MFTNIVVLALAGYSLAAVVPRDDGRSTSSDAEPTIRTFTFPPLPISTGISFPFAEEAKKRAAEAEAEFVANGPSPTKEKKRTEIEFGSAPNPTDVQITGLTYGGTGCPTGSVGSAISDDLTVMTLIFSDYVASIGPGIVVTESRKNCQLNLALEYPGGFQYSIFSAEYRGYADLDAGISGKQQSTYYFSGQIAQSSTGTTWTGPYVDDYEAVDQAASASLIYSPCGANANLNINSQISLTSTNSSASGFLTTDSIDTSFTQQIYIQWQACGGSTTTTSTTSTTSAKTTSTTSTKPTSTKTTSTKPATTTTKAA